MKKIDSIILSGKESLPLIEGGKGTRDSLDSVQQAVFASVVTGKKPAVAVYDTDGNWGKYEHRI